MNAREPVHLGPRLRLVAGAPYAALSAMSNYSSCNVAELVSAAVQESGWVLIILKVVFKEIRSGNWLSWSNETRKVFER